MMIETQLPLTEKRQFNLREILPHKLICLVLTVLFVITLIAAWKIGIGRFSSPEAGLWPFLASLAGVGLSLGLMFSAFRGAYDKDAELFSDVHWQPTVVFLTAILGFLAVYPLVGILAAAIPMLFLLMKYAAGARWLPSLLVAGIAPVVIYFIFRDVLNVSF